MKKNNVIKDKKVLSALTIGISAMMFLQTPVSAYAANNGELDDTPSNNNTESSESQSESNYEPITNEEQTVAAQAQEACVSQNDVIPATEESPAIGSAQVESQEAANIIVNGDEAKHVEKAGEEFADLQSTPAAINNLVVAANEVLNDKAAGSENLSNIQAAAEDITGSAESAKEQIAEAEKANKAADKAYNDSVSAVDKAADIMGTTEDDKVPGLIKTQENIDGIVADTNTKGQEIVDKIANAKTDEEVAAAKGELDKLIKDSKDDLESQIQLFNGLSDSFDKALGELKDAQDALDQAEDDYQGALDNAERKTDDAESKVSIASQKVENLAQAMDDALAAIDAMEASPDGLDDTRGTNWAGKFGGEVSDSRDVMKQVIKDYYLTQILGIDLVVDEDHKVKFTDPNNNSGNYERNFTTVTYYYNDNGEIKQATKYFNWDSIAKTDKEHQNLYNRNTKEASTGIVIYEKDEQEVNPTKVHDDIAAELLSAHSNDPKYYRNGKFMLDSEDNITRGKQQGMFRLYSYVDASGNVQQITQFELFGGNPGDLYPVLKNSAGKYNDQGNLTKVFEVVDLGEGKTGYRNQWTGVVYEGLKEITPDDLVEQNKNGLYKNANCLILGDTDVISTVLKGGSYNGVDYSFVKENVVDKYGISDEKIKKLIEANARLNKYIDTNSTAGINKLKVKYNTYATEVVEAQKAVENAQNQVSELSGAIDSLRNKSVKKSKTMIAKDALGVNDIATHFGLTGLDKAQAAELNTLTLAGLINRLSELRKDAKDKVDTAKDRLNGVIDVLIANADSASVRPSGGGDDDTPSGGGDTTPATPATGGVIAATPTAPTAPILAAVDAAINMDAVQAVGGQGAGVAVQDGQGGAGNVEIADGDVALSETPDAAPVTEDIEETLAEQADIQDPDVALASSMPAAEDAAKMSWWWIFIIAVLGVTGKKMYEEHMRKEEEKNKNKQD